VAERVFIGLGSNLGRRRQNLLKALEMLNQVPGYQALACSSCYLNPPMGPQDQPWFMNAVVMGHYQGEPTKLLEQLMQIESALGRRRQERWGPRTIDLDLLIFGQLVADLPGLTLPHPGIPYRAFVLVPLAEIAPGLVVPGWDKRVEEMLKALGESSRVLEKVPWDWEAYCASL